MIPIALNDGELDLSERQCPKCRAEISRDKLASSFAENFSHTQAITSANKFLSLDLAVIPFLASSILLVFMNFPLSFRIPFLLVYHMPIVLAVKWFHKYWYNLRFSDEEYLASVRQMKRFLLIWVAANLINWLMLIAEKVLLTT